jgi:hypothetical protein
VTLPLRSSLAERMGPGGGLPGALLLTGSEQARLDREAVALAAALLCPGEDPERRCEACRRVAERLHPDLLVIEPDGVAIRVDRVREALIFAAGRPYESPRRVAIVSRAELLGAESGNALLKSLEEPGSRFHWILTTGRAEALLPTILSRCTVARIAPPPAAERLAAWRDRGFDEADASDLALLEREGGDAKPEDLEEYRRWRVQALEALEAGLVSGDLPALLTLSESLARKEEEKEDGPRLLAELLADAAACGLVSPELLRHRAAAGTLARISRAAPREALERAALRAADAPPDTRRGNRRLHLESVLLELFLSRDARDGTRESGPTTVNA